MQIISYFRRASPPSPLLVGEIDRPEHCSPSALEWALLVEYDAALAALRELVAVVLLADHGGVADDRHHAAVVAARVVLRP